MQANEFLLRCQKTAAQRFGINQLRDSQIQVLKSLCPLDHTQMEAVLATMPTGSGKTLIYALASVVWKKPVLVISPLLALMREQVQRMRSAHIKAFMTSGEQTLEEKFELASLIKKKDVDMIFASPEKCFTKSFQNLLMSFKPFIVVCDEAHCVASWGHGFRPEYARIADFISLVNPKKVLALSATIPGSLKSIVQSRLVHMPHNSQWKEILSDPLPQHLYLESFRIYSEQERKSLLFEIINKSSSHKVIIYFGRRSLCETTAALLKQSGYNAYSYHAGLDKEQRKKIEDILKTSEQFVVCATLAYGMGVDLIGVQHVICYGLPNGIADFIQMIGRAGRNGGVARGSLLWTGSDVKKREYQYKINFPSLRTLQMAFASVVNHLPKPPSVRWLSWNQLTKIWGEAGLKESIFPGLINAFRFLGLVQSTQAYGSYLVIELDNNISLNNELSLLPSHITQRSQVLGALKRHQGDKWSSIKGAEAVVPLHELEEIVGFPFFQFEKVLCHFKEKGLVQFRIKTGLELDEGLLLERNSSLSRPVLRDYERVAQAEKESLTQLVELANSKDCRLSQCKKYFNGDKMSNVALNTYMVYCNQCDMCMGRQKQYGGVFPSGDMYNNFLTFQKLWSDLGQNQTVTL